MKRLYSSQWARGPRPYDYGHTLHKCQRALAILIPNMRVVEGLKWKDYILSCWWSDP